MKWVHIVENTMVGTSMTPRTVATVVFKDGRVRVEGDSAVADEVRAGKMPLAPVGMAQSLADGEPFLQSLQLRYRTAYLFATGVQEGAEVTPFTAPSARKAD